MITRIMILKTWHQRTNSILEMKTLEYIQYPEKYKLHIKQKISMFVFNAVSLK